MAVDPYTAALTWARRKYGRQIGAGLYRCVFGESPAYVVKVPRDEWGEFCNEGEAREAPTAAIFARCKAFKHPRTGDRRQALATVLKHGRVDTQYRGLAACRICQRMLGSADLIAYDMIYPQGAEHYITAHGVWTPACDELLRRAASAP